MSTSPKPQIKATISRDEVTVHAPKETIDENFDATLTFNVASGVSLKSGYQTDPTQGADLINARYKSTSTSTERLCLRIAFVMQSIRDSKNEELADDLINKMSEEMSTLAPNGFRRLADDERARRWFSELNIEYTAPEAA